MGIAAPEGAIGGGEIPRAAGGIDELVQPVRGGSVEGIVRFFKRLEAVGIQTSRPQIDIIAGEIAIAAENMGEMWRGVARADLFRHADACQGLSLRLLGIAARRECM